MDKEEEDRIREEAIRILQDATVCSFCGKEGKAVWECKSKEHDEE